MNTRWSRARATSGTRYAVLYFIAFRTHAQNENGRTLVTWILLKRNKYVAFVISLFVKFPKFSVHKDLIQDDVFYVSTSCTSLWTIFGVCSVHNIQYCVILACRVCVR